MQILRDFLSKYARFTPPDTVVKKHLSGILSKELNRTIPEKNIRIIGPVAYCTLESAVKNILLFKKITILDQLEQEVGKRIVRDIQ